LTSSLIRHAYLVAAIEFTAQQGVNLQHASRLDADSGEFVGGGHLGLPQKGFGLHRNTGFTSNPHFQGRIWHFMRRDLRAEELAKHVESRLEEAGVRSGDGVVVAVSGGVDSVVLFDILHHLAPTLVLNLHVVHLDHRLRPDSATDAAYVKALAERHGWPVTVESADVAAKSREFSLSLEQAGRACRRDLWQRVRERTGAAWVALGHHVDDQAETVLLRLLRGAGTTGLGAMRLVSADRLLRPLLAVRRSSIQAYAKKRNLQFKVDPTNADLQIPRNRVRHELVPLLENRHNPNIVEGLARTARLLQADDDYLTGVSEEAAHRVLKVRRGTCLTLDTGVLRGYHIAVQRRVLRQYLQEFAPLGTSLFAVVEGILERVAQGASGMHQMSGDIWAENTGVDLVLRRGFATSVVTSVALPGETSVPERDAILRATFIPSTAFADLLPGLGIWRAVFDARVIDGGLQLRGPRRGDRLCPFGLAGHHKKLSDCFIDAKWPRILRSDALLLTRVAQQDGEHEEVLWVAGLIQSEAFRVTPTTERILYLEFDTGLPESGTSNPQLQR